MPDPVPQPQEPSSSRQRHYSFDRTDNLRRLHTDQSLAQSVRLVLDCMKNVNINLPIFLWAISWNIQELITDLTVTAERTALMLSDELPGILAHWRRPPRKHSQGVRTKGACDTMNKFALDSVLDLVDNEMGNLDDILSSPQSDLSEEGLLSIKMKDLMATVCHKAPTTFTLFRHAAYTQKQESRNTIKNPDNCVLMMIAMAAFSRSHHLCKLQKLMTVYFKSCGLATKALDTLHVLCITMSQKWSYQGIQTLSESAREAMAEDIANYPWFGIHDNVNIAFKIYEQRLNNQSHFDSGTAGTIVVIKDPACVTPDYTASRLKFIEGVNNPISFKDIVQLEVKASGRLKSFAVHRILKFLTEAPEFDFENYKYRDNNIFSRPASAFQLETGPTSVSCQYMLDLLHIDEVSYEGNDRVLEEWFRQLKLTAKGDQLVLWAGDQLTVSRIRGLKRFRCMDLNSHDRLEFLKPIFGWFHAQMAIEHSLHSQYWGTRAGHGLVHAFELLNRKGLSSPSIQGIFHQNIKEGLTHVAAARFRDVWCTVGKVKDLKALNKLTPELLEGMAIEIVHKFASVRALHSISGKPSDAQDDVLLQAILWNKDILDYLTLNDAVSSGDVELIQDLLPRLLFRFVGGSNSKYALEVLELIQGLYREWPEDLRNYITRYCWLANTTGHANSFLPIDLLQEHNIRDIKHVFAAIGPFATWDYIRKMSSSIPCQRRVKDHVEAEVNTFLRGKSHTSPDAEEDIQNLQAAYQKDEIHVFKAGRKLQAKDKVKDYMAIAAEGTKLKKVITRWIANRLSEVSTTEDFEVHDT